MSGKRPPPRGPCPMLSGEDAKTKKSKAKGDKNTAKQNIAVVAFLRNVFWILPLFLVLMPDASSVCMDAIRNEYQNLLSISISHLTDTLGSITPTVISCNSTKENTTVRNAVACKCCCHSNKEKALRCMARCLKKISEICIFSISGLQDSMDDVSNGTLEILKRQCNATVKKTRPKCPSENCCQTSDTICCTKKIVSDLKSCWSQFIR